MGNTGASRCAGPGHSRAEPEEVSALRASVPLRVRKRGDGLTVCRCGEAKSPNAVRCKECYLPRWRADQDDRLREFVAAGWEYKAMARILKRTADACRNRATFLGLKMDQAAILENRQRGRDRFNNNPMKAARRIKRLMKSFTPLDRQIRAEELRQRNMAGTAGIKGRHHTPEVCARISAANKGRKMAESTKRKISEARKAYWAAKRDGGQAAYRAAMLADEGRKRRLNDDKLHEERRIWCGQCERQVSTARASACASQFCKAKELAA